MWPILDSFQAKITKAKKDGEVIGLVISSDNEFKGLNVAALASFGFTEHESAEGQLKSMLSAKQTFLLSELKLWVPGFDSKTMIDKSMPSPVTDITPSAPVHALTEASDRQVKKQSKAKIVDAGEKIGNARKDLYSKQITTSDLVGMVDDDRDSLIKKSMWVYSYKEAKERGVSCGVADWIKTLRFNFPEMGAITRLSHEGFIRAIDCLRSHLDPVKTVDELVDAILELQKDPDWIEYKKISDDSSIASSWYKKSWRANGMLSLRQEYVDHNRSHGREITPSMYRPALDDAQNEEIIARWWSKKLGVKTQEQLDEKRLARNQGPKIPDRPHLDHLENAWVKDGDEDITTDELMHRFGFRAIEFGEWLPQDERQRVLNEACSACVALSETLNIPEKMVSLNGVLAAAFGSRGKGRAMAHYESALEVFNLTRMKGAGSMAHEWAHALDDHLYRNLFDGEHGFLTEACHASSAMSEVMLAIRSKKDPSHWLNEKMADLVRGVEWGSSWLRLGSSEATDEAKRIVLDMVFASSGMQPHEDDISKIASGSGLRIDVSKAKFAEVDNQTSYELYDDLRNVLAQKFPDRARTSLREDPSSARGKKDPSKQFWLNIASSLTAAQAIARYVRTGDERHSGYSDTSFNLASKTLDKGKSKEYWQTGREMFARAFECYVYDALQVSGRPCDYLVHSVEASKYSGDEYVACPYPAGEERSVINAKMAQFANQIEYLMSNSARMHRAIKTHNFELFEKSVLGGADVNSPDEKGVLPLFAVINNQFFGSAQVKKSVDLLLEHGAIITSEVACLVKGGAVDADISAMIVAPVVTNEESSLGGERQKMRMRA